LRLDFLSFAVSGFRPNERPHKEWSLTDCMSFVEKRLSEALIDDRDFEKAGFQALPVLKIASVVLLRVFGEYAELRTNVLDHCTFRGKTSAQV
jgi:hypothetical protein